MGFVRGGRRDQRVRREGVCVGFVRGGRGDQRVRREGVCVGFLEVVYDSFDALGELGDVEVDEEAEFAVGEAEIGE